MIRLPEVGDEIDGRVIAEVGTANRINDNHTVLSVRMRDGACEIVSLMDYPGETLRMRIWNTDSTDARAALDRSVELPVATRGGTAEIHVRGRDGRGAFSATFYYNEKKMDDVADAFAYR